LFSQENKIDYVAISSIPEDVLEEFGEEMPAEEMTKPCLTCDLCGKVFNSTGAKSNHRWVHEKKTKCPHCPVTVTRPSD